VLIERSPLLT